ncbi:MAG: hypothetical protein KJ737_01505 [Proteobacteria bacterium]|nr:hypothetical protein [Pseudomonadota bacterium]
MGKITNITEGINIPKQQNVKKTDTQEFQKALDAALEGKKSSDSIQGPANSLGEIAPTTLHAIEPSTESIFDRTNFLLDKLDIYTKDLENPEKTLKDIEPLIVSIQEEALKLLETTNETGSKDQKLKDIVNQTAIKANTEFIKFTRGDYI